LHGKFTFRLTFYNLAGLKTIFRAIRDFSREILQIGNDRSKNRAVSEIKDFYDDDFNHNYINYDDNEKN
jgi:hypothetical protein